MTPRILRSLLTLGIVGACFNLLAPALLGTERLAFRDVGHFYSPLYGHLADRSHQEWLPLWNPLDRFGVPVVGEASTAVLYPLRALFMLPIHVDSAVALFVLLHLLIAGAGAYWAARYSGASPVPAHLAAIAYPASGGVFFLYTNPPFLVGAAWLPLAIIGLWRSAESLTARSVALAAFPLAMCVLGGDAQTALHAVLISLSVWVIRPGTPTTARRPDLSREKLQDDGSINASASPPPPDTRWRGPRGAWARLRTGLAGMSVSCLCAGLIALPQIWATLDWSRQSWRRATAPASLVDLSIHPAHDSAAGLERNSESHPEPLGHRGDVYRYSLAPWHLLQLATPQAGGHLAPINTRVSALVPGDPQMWAPTIYCGYVAFVMFCAGSLGPTRWNRWFVIALLGFATALGQYGLGYLLRTLLYWMGHQVGDASGDSVGGVYWILVSCLPGYGHFRFPMKWLPVAALGMTVFAATRLSDLRRDEARRAVQISLIFSALSGVALLALTLPVTVSEIEHVIRQHPRMDRFWGPLVPEAVVNMLRGSFAATLALAIVTAWVFRLWVRSERLATQPGTPSGAIRLAPSAALTTTLVVLTGIDMGMVAAWQLITVPANRRPLAGVDDGALVLEQPPAEMTRGTTPPRYLLTTSDVRPPADWRRTSDARRAGDVERWMRATWFVRWHLADRVAVVNNVVSIPSARTEMLWAAVNAYSTDLPAADHREFFHKLAEKLCIAEVGVPSLPDTKAFPDQQDWVQWHSQWTAVAPHSPVQMRGLTEFLARIHGAEGMAAPELEWPVHTGAPPQPDPRAQARPLRAELTVDFWSPSEVRCSVRSQVAGLATMLQLQDGNWQAEIRSSSTARWQPTAVYTADVVGQGVFVGAGEHQVRFIYRPTWLVPSLAVSLLTIGSMLVLLVKNREKVSS